MNDILYCSHDTYILKQIFGTEHSYTAFFLHNLAFLYCDQGRYQEAEDLARRALSIYEQPLQAGHRVRAHPLPWVKVTPVVTMDERIRSQESKNLVKGQQILAQWFDQ